MCFWKESKTEQQKSTHNNTCENRESNPRHFTQQSDALLLDHLENSTYWLPSRYLIVSKLWVKTEINEMRVRRQSFATYIFINDSPYLI